MLSDITREEIFAIISEIASVHLQQPVDTKGLFLVCSF